VPLSFRKISGFCLNTAITESARTSFQISTFHPVVRKNTLAAEQGKCPTASTKKAENVDQSDSSVPFAAASEDTPALGKDGLHLTPFPLQEALRLEPSRAETHYLLARVYQRLKRTADFQRELELSQKFQKQKLEQDQSLLEATGSHGDPTQGLLDGMKGDTRSGLVIRAPTKRFGGKWKRRSVLPSQTAG